MTDISHIVCVDLSSNIGVNNKMPWGHIKEELNYFYNITKDHIVIMGRNTYESIGQPLRDRVNIIISTQYEELTKDPLYVRETIDSAIELAKTLAEEKQCDIFIIGGKTIYEQTQDIVNKAYITVLDTDYTHRPIQGIHKYPVDFVKYNTEYISDNFNLISKDNLKSYFLHKIIVTVWERNSGDLLDVN